MNRSATESQRDSLLISPASLAAALGEAAATDWVVVDCRFSLLQPDAGRAAYAQGHIPGARYADLDRQLSGPRGPSTGRHPLPQPDELRRLFSSFGITARTTVVAYDDAAGALAARLWWLLRWMGHARALVLDGGLGAWQKAGLPLDTGQPEPGSALFVGEPGHMPVMDAGAVAAGLASQSIRLLDVRAEERFQGRVEPIDPVAGHVPGAVNAPFTGNLDQEGRFRSGPELGARYAPLVADRRPADVVCMCGSGVTACHGILALELAGLPGAALYAGSWSEWIRSPDRPVARV